MQIVLYALLALLVLFALSLTPPGRGLRQRMMARFYTRAQADHEAHVADRKRALLGTLSGTVLEIGPGTGVNFQYLPDGVKAWIGIEPNPHMHTELHAAGARHAIPTEFRLLSTEGMAVDDESVDAVLSTLVLCSVPDPDAVLRDIRRILKPGGRFVFLEHVADHDGTRLRRIQGLARPVWRYFADGCRPDRALGTSIREAGFADVEMERFVIPKDVVPAVVSPHIAGVAVK
jgi:SAM-dependent methyltransferase